MSFGDAIQRRADLLRKRGADLDRIFRDISKGATQRAIAAAEDKTSPPPARILKHPSKATGTLKQHWATDSKVEPEIRPHPGGGAEFVTVLGNDMDYASYVDQGHKIVVKTKEGLKEVGFCPGVFMAEAGHDAFETAALAELDKITERMFRDG